MAPSTPGQTPNRHLSSSTAGDDAARERRAIVTGAARRVGRAIALRLASEGWQLHLTFHRSHADMQATAEACRAAGAPSVEVHQVDLADATAVAGWSNELARSIGTLHGLVHNAARYVATPWGSVDQAELEAHYRVNALAPLLITQAFDAPLRKARGSVVNFADIHVMGRPRRNFAAYSLSKAAVVELTWTLARELAPEVRVNAIAPGVVAWPPDTPQSEVDAYERRIPRGRSGTPEDAADLTAFLLSPGSCYISGEIIRLDGGRWLR